MAYPVIRINNVTGSDTQASGAGPDPAIYGTQAATSSYGGNTKVDLSLDNPDLSGVAADGSHALWIDDPSGGKQISRIIEVSNTAKYVVVEPINNSLSGAAWAIGGKRASLKHIGSDDYCTWEVEYTGQPYYWDSSIDYRTIAQHTVVRGTGSDRPRIVVTPDANGDYRFLRASTGSQNYLHITYLEFVSDVYQNSGGMPADGAALIEIKDQGSVTDCVFYHIPRPFSGGSINLINCSFIGFYGLNHGSHPNAVLINCLLDGKGYPAGSFMSVDYYGLYCKGCIFRNGVTAISFTSPDYAYPRVVDGCIIDGMSGDGIVFGNSSRLCKVMNTVIYGCSGYAIKWSSEHWVASQLIGTTIQGVAAGANTSGFSNKFSLTPDITLTEDPFVDRLNGNYALNDAPGGGKLLKETGWPQTWPGLPNTTSYPDVGAVQSKKSSKPLVVPSTARTKWWV